MVCYLDKIGLQIYLLQSLKKVTTLVFYYVIGNLLNESMKVYFRLLNNH